MVCYLNNVTKLKRYVAVSFCLRHAVTNYRLVSTVDSLQKILCQIIYISDEINTHLINFLCWSKFYRAMASANRWSRIIYKLREFIEAHHSYETVLLGKRSWAIFLIMKIDLADLRQHISNEEQSWEFFCNAPDSKNLSPGDFGRDILKLKN